MSFRNSKQLPPLGLVSKGNLTGANSANSANQARFLTLNLPRAVAFTRLRFIVFTQSGNFDVGIYDNGLQRLVSLGSTPVPAAGVTDMSLGAVWSLPAGNYYLAFVLDNGVAIFKGQNNINAENDTNNTGTLSAAFPLPANASAAAFNNSSAGLPLLTLAEAGS